MYVSSMVYRYILLMYVCRALHMLMQLAIH